MEVFEQPVNETGVVAMRESRHENVDKQRKIFVSLTLLRPDVDIYIDIEILFCIEYCTTCNISLVGLLLRQTKINKQILKQRVSQDAHI